MVLQWCFRIESALRNAAWSFILRRQSRILGWSLPIDYLHCVVTLPHEFIPLILANDNAMYRLFFACVGRALRELAMEKHGAQVGVVMVLHSWGQRMNSIPISTPS
ncbi:MAG: hypothetical protein R3E01_31290 [Pirellulaceae bacterium]